MPTPITTSTQPALKSQSLFGKILVLLLILGLGALAYFQYEKRMQVARELKKLTIQMEQLKDNTPQQNAAIAKEVIEKVKKHILIPSDNPTVATIVNVEALKQKNDFYRNAKNGFNLVISPTRAILYDPENDLIVDVSPVQLETPNPAAPVTQPAGRN